ncbi:hypothetical protein T484DRAFT_3630844, partial [Baffinella frigidus]
MRTAAPLQEFSGKTGHLRVTFRADAGTGASFTATWSTTIKQPECSPCEAGTYKDSTGASKCTACPRNAWSTSIKPPACSLCAAGTYKDSAGASKCTACPPNTVSDEGSTDRSSCECAAGYTGDAGAGQGCVPCEAGTYKAVSGSAECTACPSNAVSLRGSTGLSSCFCPGGYAGDAGTGEACEACEAGTFKPFDGPAACVSCPGDQVSAQGGRSCECGAGHVFEHNVPSVTCSGSCGCTSSVGVSTGAMTNVLDGLVGGDPSCTWIISG